MMSCITPHVGEEIWQLLGHEDTIAFEPWPAYSEEKCRDDEISIAVQINGKVRSVVTVSAEAEEEEIRRLALEDGKIRAAMQGMQVVKAIVIKKKIVNFVVKPL